jgi:chromosome segregation ATPase
MEISSAVSHKVLQNQTQIAEVKDALKAMDRKLSKTQSRVLLCTEQLKALRKLTVDTRTVATETLTNHATTLADVQEQTNSLQHVLSSLQDIVVKQIEVCTPIARVQICLQMQNASVI